MKFLSSGKKNTKKKNGDGKKLPAKNNIFKKYKKENDECENFLMFC